MITYENFNLTCKNDVTLFGGASINYDKFIDGAIMIGGNLPIGLPYGTTAERPLNSPYPLIRYNIEDDVFELYNHIDHIWVQYNSSVSGEEGAYFIKKDEGFIAGDKSISSIGENSIYIRTKSGTSPETVGCNTYIIGSNHWVQGNKNIIIGNRIIQSQPTTHDSIVIGSGYFRDYTIGIGDRISHTTSSSFSTSIGALLISSNVNNFLIGVSLRSSEDNEIKIGVSDSSYTDSSYIKLNKNGRLIISKNSNTEENYYDILNDGEYTIKTSGDDMLTIIARIEDKLYYRHIQLTDY